MKRRFRPHHALRFRTVQAEDDDATTLPVPGFRQTRSYTCGFTTALMVLRYFDADVPAMTLFRRLGTHRDGTRQTALVREIRAAGLRVNARYDIDFARICHAIDHNKLIVGYLSDIEHWLVIYGYGHRPKRVFVADPRPDEPCEHLWGDYGARLGSYGMIVSHPGDTAPARQTPLELAEPPEPPVVVAAPPLPLVQLRCEVHDIERDARPAPSLQLSLPFGPWPAESNDASTPGSAPGTPGPVDAHA